MLCPKCHKDVSDGYKFCPNCGEELDLDKAQNYYSGENNQADNKEGDWQNNAYSKPNNYQGSYNSQENTQYQNNQGYNQNYNQNYNPNYNQSYQPGFNENSVGLNILSFLIPLVGLILWLSFKDSEPIKAKNIGTWALISVGVAIFLYVLLIVVIAVAGISMY